jgi:hypothetical protein
MENLEIMCRIASSHNLVQYASRRPVILESGVPVVGS